MASAQFPLPPATLKPILGYMKVASDHETKDPVLTYWCRLYAAQTALKVDSKSHESRIYIVQVMDWLEKEKKAKKDVDTFANELVAQAHVEDYALQLFNKADSEDRAGRPDKNACRLYFTSSQIFDVMAVFGEPSEEVAQKGKYAKYRAAYINRCLRNGETPVPAPPLENEESAEDDDGDFRLNEFGSSAANGPPEEPQRPTTSGRFVPVPEPESERYTTTSGATLKTEDFLRAQKLCKFAGSALQYEDVPTAVTNLQKALSLLLTGQEED